MALGESLTSAAVDRLRKRLQAAVIKAYCEADAHPDRDRATYSDGQVAGLRAALIMLEEEVSR